MELIIESYTKEQYDVILSDLVCIIENIAQNVGIPNNVMKIIIPIDFDATINKLEISECYTSNRNHLAIGKIVSIEGGVAIVLSHVIYSDEFDQCLRCLLILHELIHALNKNRFTFPEAKYPANEGHIINLYCLFDEYYSNRLALELIDIIFKEKTKLFKQHIAKAFNGHIKLLINNHYCNSINSAIKTYRKTRDREILLDNIFQYFDEASKDIIYAYAFLDHYPKLKRIEPIILQSEIINNKTIRLIEFYRSKYSTDDIENDIDLKEGLPLMKRYTTNFGFVPVNNLGGGVYNYFFDI